MERPLSEPRLLRANKNEGSLDSDDWRAMRILAEHLEPLHRFKREQDC